jgi:ATP-dependent DNA helicase RecG
LDYFAELLAQVKALHYVGSDAHNRDNILQKLAERELFANQASLAKIRSQEHKSRGRSFCVESEDCHGHNITLAMTGDILRKLGFELTQGQKEVISEIEHDQASGFQMMRLLQGDVGSGKTLVALLTMLNVVNSGAQSALMVPTDLLSLQHYQFFCQALEGMNVRVELLTGKTTAKQKKQIQTDLLEGSIDILIGTHALFQEKVEFKDLGYIIIDEQHRFGVEQRLELIKKASNPDVLVMTATPIPRSLTLTMFGDMDVSQLKTKPRNRLPIITTIISNEKKREVIESLSKKLQTGEKIYWVCPLVDEKDATLEGAEDEVIPLSNVTGRFLELENIYSGQVSMIHGKLKGDLKDQIMQEFKESNKSILVATTVIEVGIDVPQASLIIIENAEKFGLAQLHQLRGRVGRGARQSNCLLMYNPKRLSTLGRQRLKIMRESNDGFYIAEQDLILRGGGEILGTKQSGEPEFFFADLARDLKILLEVNQQVKSLRHDEFIDFQIDLFAKNKRELVRGG